MQVKKPDFKIFAGGAEDGELHDFPDVARGWGVTKLQTNKKPPLSWMNGAFNRVDNNFYYLLQNGLAEWDESLDYSKGALSQVDGVIYRSKEAVKGESPTTSAKWEKLFADKTGDSEFVSINQKAATKALSEQDPKKWGLGVAYTNKIDEPSASGFYLDDSVGTSTGRPRSVFIRLVGASDRFIGVDNSGVLFYKSYGDLQSTSIVSIPIGATIEWQSSAKIPKGFMANEGRSFSADTYQELAKVFPDLKLPDDRGYVKRGLDLTSSVDPDGGSRKVGGIQGDAMRNLTGEISRSMGVFVYGSKKEDKTAMYSIERTSDQEVSNQSGTAANLSGFKFDASNQVPTASEFRMKNKATIFITRVE